MKQAGLPGLACGDFKAMSAVGIKMVMDVQSVATELPKSARGQARGHQQRRAPRAGSCPSPIARPTRHSAQATHGTMISTAVTGPGSQKKHQAASSEQIKAVSMRPSYSVGVPRDQ